MPSNLELFPTPAPLALFNFEGVDMRITDQAGDPWFVAGDVGKTLGYDHTPHLLRLVDDDEKGVHIVDTLGGPQKVNLISQAGLLRAITQRRATAGLDPEIAARVTRFQRWVFHDVLPSILRTGSYSAPVAKVATTREIKQTFSDYRAIAKLIGLDAANASIAAGNATAKITGVNPLQVLGQTHFVADVQQNLLTATQIGMKLGGPSGRAINLRLQALGYQTPVLDSRGKHDGWEPTEKGRPFGNWSTTGKSHNDGTSIMQWRWYASIVNEIEALIGTSLNNKSDGDDA